jgi:hypothetical protein
VVVVAVVVPGGVFAVPLFVLALVAWGAYRYVRARRDGPAAGPHA